MTNAILRGKPDAGNPHVRFDEGEVASAKPRRGSLLYKISLITACYNSAETIGAAIESVLSQKGVDVEYIVVDGGSKDGTVDIIKEDADKTLNSQLLTPNFTFRWLSESDKGNWVADKITRISTAHFASL